jgi:hypothetical protein
MKYTYLFLVLAWTVLDGNSLAMDVPEKRNQTNPFAKYVTILPGGRLIDYPAMETDRPLTEAQKERILQIGQIINKHQYWGDIVTYEGTVESYTHYCKGIMHGATIKQLSEICDYLIIHMEQIILKLWKRGILKDEDFADREDLSRLRKLCNINSFSGFSKPFYIQKN